MKTTAQLAVLIAIALSLAACREEPAQAAPRLEMETIETAPLRPVPVEPPPVIEEQTLPQRPVVAAARPKAAPGTEGEQPTEDEMLRARTNLPFAPPIALDPVDGSKVSITKETPIYSYKNQWYYFSTEANRRQFAADPEQYASGRLSRY